MQQYSRGGVNAFYSNTGCVLKPFKLLLKRKCYPEADKCEDEVITELEGSHPSSL